NYLCSSSVDNLGRERCLARKAVQFALDVLPSALVARKASRAPSHAHVFGAAVHRTALRSQAAMLLLAIGVNRRYLTTGRAIFVAGCLRTERQRAKMSKLKIARAIQIKLKVIR